MGYDRHDKAKLAAVSFFKVIQPLSEAIGRALDSMNAKDLAEILNVISGAVTEYGSLAGFADAGDTTADAIIALKPTMAMAKSLPVMRAGNGDKQRNEVCVMQAQCILNAIFFICIGWRAALYAEGDEDAIAAEWMAGIRGNNKNNPLK